MALTLQSTPLASEEGIIPMTILSPFRAISSRTMSMENFSKNPEKANSTPVFWSSSIKLSVDCCREKIASHNVSLQLYIYRLIFQTTHADFVYMYYCKIYCTVNSRLPRFCLRYTSIDWDSRLPRFCLQTLHVHILTCKCMVNFSFL